jgi:hypothetical protein
MSAVYGQMEGDGFLTGVATQADRKAGTAKVVSVANRGNRS